MPETSLISVSLLSLWRRLGLQILALQLGVALTPGMTPEMAWALALDLALDLALALAPVRSLQATAATNSRCNLVIHQK